MTISDSICEWLDEKTKEIKQREELREIIGKSLLEYGEYNRRRYEAVIRGFMDRGKWRRNVRQRRKHMADELLAAVLGVLERKETE